MTGQQLKNSILQMAVQGKLVPQDPNDEPASVLLERIRKEKEQLIKDGKIKKEKNPSIIFRGADNLPYEKVGNNKPVCIANEVPFDIPDSWEWVRLKDIAYVNGGFAFKSTNFTDTGIRVIRISDFNETGFINNKIVRHFFDSSLEQFLLEEKNILLCMTGGTVGKSLFVTKMNEPMVTNQRVATIKIFGALEEYVNLVILSPITQKVINNSKNSTNDNISMDTINNLFVPIPPHLEQIQIVNKFKYIEEFIQKYNAIEERLKYLNNLFPDLLKKSILQEAVQGKLVPQDPNDEPASVLLERIRAEKQALVKAGKIKKDKHESVIFRRDNSHYEKRGSEEVCIDDEIPFEIPDTWEWCRIGSLLQVNPRNNLSDDTDAGFVPMVLIKDGFNNEHSFEERKWGKIKSGFTHFANNDVIVAKITPCFQNRKSAVIANLPNGIGAGTTELHVLRDVTSQLCMQYILLLFKTNEFIKNGVKNFSGTAGQQRIGKDFISNYLIPLPPVKEQERIVNSVLKVFSRVNSLAD